MTSPQLASPVARVLLWARTCAAAAALGLLSAVPASAQLDLVPGTWVDAGLLSTARSSHTSTLLPGGQVLVAGGADNDGNPLASAELYLPETEISTATDGLTTPRFQHTATLLPNGRVLVVGGIDSHNNNLASAELYNPATGLWTPTGSLATARVSFTATLLPNGKVLVAGGQGNGVGDLASAELYDPATGAWTATGSLAAGRDSHTATLLPNGKVLVAAGYRDRALGTAELYDPASGTWSATGSLAGPRADHTATLLRSGLVVVAGGTAKGNHLASAELYDPATGSWSATGNLGSPRMMHTATLLPNGQVLIADGFDLDYMPGAEVYDPASRTWTATGNLSEGRAHHTATLLPSGQLFLAGGGGASGNLASAELYQALDVSAAGQPEITSALFNAAGQLVLSGSGFSSGQVQLRWLDNDQSVALTRDSSTVGSATDYTSTLGAALRPGYALVTVFSNGVPSAALVVANPSVTPAATAPTVTTPTSTALAPSTATLGGKVIANGGAPLTERGVVFSRTAVNADPTIGGNGVTKVVEGALAIGVFTKAVTGLSANTAYSLKAYATNSAGTSYSNVTTFVTPLPFSGTDDAVSTAGSATRIYPLANDRTASGAALRLVSVSNPAILIAGRSLVVPAGFTGLFTYVFTDGVVSGQARVTVTAATPVVHPYVFSGLLRDGTGVIAGALDLTFPTTGRVATFVLTARTTVVKSTLTLAASGLTGARATTLGTLTITRNPDQTVTAKLAAAGGDLTGFLQPRHAPGLSAKYNIALAGVDPAIRGGAHAFVTIGTTGGAALLIVLPDGTVCSTGTSLRDNNTIAFYAIAKSGLNPPAVVRGELVLANLTATDLTGEWAWSKPAQRSNIAGVHLGGAETLLTANGCRYNGQILLAGAATLRLSGGNLPATENDAVVVAAGKPVVPAGSVKTWVIGSASGNFATSVMLPGKPKPVAGRGLYLPKTNRAWGFFPGTTVGGRIELFLSAVSDGDNLEELPDEGASVPTEPVVP